MGTIRRFLTPSLSQCHKNSLQIELWISENNLWCNDCCRTVAFLACSFSTEFRTRIQICWWRRIWTPASSSERIWSGTIVRSCAEHVFRATVRSVCDCDIQRTMWLLCETKSTQHDCFHTHFKEMWTLFLSFIVSKCGSIWSPFCHMCAFVLKLTWLSMTQKCSLNLDLLLHVWRFDFACDCLRRKSQSAGLLYS